MRLAARDWFQLWPLLVASVGYGGLLAVYLFAARGNWTFFVHFADTHKVTQAFGGQAAGLWVGGGGHDGMQYYAIARAPFNWDLLRAVLDYPLLRYRRIVYPLLVYYLSLGQTALIAPVMLTVNVGATLGGMYILRHLLAGQGLGAAWTLLYAFHPGIILSLLYNLPTGVAMLGVLAGLAWWERGRRILAALSLTAALLTWEVLVLPTLLAWVGHAALMRLSYGRTRSPFPWALGLPLVVGGVWEVALTRLFPSQMSLQVIGNLNHVGQGWGRVPEYLTTASLDARRGFLFVFLGLVAVSVVVAAVAFFTSPSLPTTVAMMHALLVLHLSVPNLIWPVEVTRKSLGLWFGLLLWHAQHRGRWSRWILGGITVSTLLLLPWLPPVSVR